MFQDKAMSYPLPYLTTMLFGFFFKVEHDCPPKTTRFRDLSDVNTDRLAENIDADFLICSPLVWNQNEYVEYG